MRGGQQLQQGAGAKVGPADADDDEHIGLLADDLRGLQQALDLLAALTCLLVQQRSALKTRNTLAPRQLQNSIQIAWS